MWHHKYLCDCRLDALRSGVAASSLTGLPVATASTTEPSVATPYLQLGAFLINPASAEFGAAGFFPNFGLATYQLQEDESQGKQGTGAVQCGILKCVRCLTTWCRKACCNTKFHRNANSCRRHANGERAQ